MNLENIIVEHKNFYSIWVEETPGETSRGLEEQGKLTFKKEEIATKKIVKKYQGKLYQEEVVDLKVEEKKTGKVKKSQI